MIVFIWFVASGFDGLSTSLAKFVTHIFLHRNSEAHVRWPQSAQYTESTAA